MRYIYNKKKSFRQILNPEKLNINFHAVHITDEESLIIHVLTIVVSTKVISLDMVYKASLGRPTTTCFTFSPKNILTNFRMISHI